MHTPFRTILTNALAVSLTWALLGGVGYWATAQWLETMSTTPVAIVETPNYYIVLDE